MPVLNNNLDKYKLNSSGRSYERHKSHTNHSFAKRSVDVIKRHLYSYSTILDSDI